jgi:hypothetical protein
MTTTVPQLPDTLKKRGGAPKGSMNNFRHGMRGSGLPKHCGHVQRATCHFRRQLERAVLDAKGEINIVDAAFINSAYRAERHGQLAQRWLMLEAEQMSAADRLAYSREVVKASESRDRAIAALKLDRKPSDIWEALHAVTFDPDSAPCAEPQPEATP